MFGEVCWVFFQGEGMVIGELFFLWIIPIYFILAVVGILGGLLSWMSRKDWVVYRVIDDGIHCG